MCVRHGPRGFGGRAAPRVFNQCCASWSVVTEPGQTCAEEYLAQRPYRGGQGAAATPTAVSTHVPRPADETCRLRSFNETLRPVNSDAAHPVYLDKVAARASTRRNVIPKLLPTILPARQRLKNSGGCAPPNPRGPCRTHIIPPVQRLYAFGVKGREKHSHLTAYHQPE